MGIVRIAIQREILTILELGVTYQTRHKAVGSAGNRIKIVFSRVKIVFLSALSAPIGPYGLRVADVRGYTG